MSRSYYVIELSARWLTVLLVALALVMVLAFALGYGAAWSVLTAEQPAGEMTALQAAATPTEIPEVVIPTAIADATAVPAATATPTATPRPPAPTPTAPPTTTPDRNPGDRRISLSRCWPRRRAPRSSRHGPSSRASVFRATTST